MKNAKAKLAGIPDLQWRWYKLDHMQPDLLYDMLALREAIFVVEQTCIYQELDGLDKQAQHLVVKQGKLVIACLRLLPPVGQQMRVRIGRVAVAPEWRKRGLAGMMMTEAIDKARLDHPACVISLHAQSYLEAFYARLGFRVCGPEFLEDGIPHIPMEM